MKLELRGVRDAGDAAKERVVLRASLEIDIGRFAVFRAHAAEEGRILSGDIPRVYWFRDKKIKSGDLVVLYSKDGTTSEKKNDDGTTSHFFYWGADAPLWVRGYTPAVVETNTWEAGAPIE